MVERERERERESRVEWFSWLAEKCIHFRGQIAADQLEHLD